ncbi:MAG: hypothetical protein QOG25_3629, partial [Acetobacteraceae bacterium]|nr:hypothetical protein [Acetobacteraceae bacterium]
FGRLPDAYNRPEGATRHRLDPDYGEPESSENCHFSDAQSPHHSATVQFRQLIQLRTMENSMSKASRPVRVATTVAAAARVQTAVARANGGQVCARHEDTYRRNRCRRSGCRSCRKSISSASQIIPAGDRQPESPWSISRFRISGNARIRPACSAWARGPGAAAIQRSRCRAGHVRSRC